MLELSSHERNCIKTHTNVYATLHNNCNRRAVTIQTNNPNPIPDPNRDPKRARNGPETGLAPLFDMLFFSVMIRGPPHSRRPMRGWKSPSQTRAATLLSCYYPAAVAAAAMDAHMPDAMSGRACQECTHPPTPSPQPRRTSKARAPLPDGYDAYPWLFCCSYC